jgi:hypothetical protein
MIAGSVRVLAVVALATFGLEPIAAATADDRTRDSDGVVVVNGGASTSELDLLRKRIDVLGVMHPIKTAISAALVGEPPYELDPIRNAFGNFEYERADGLIETALSELFTNGAPEQIAPSAAELFYWRGLVAANDDRADDALNWFSTGLRIAPDFQFEKGAESPTVRSLMARARKIHPPKRPLQITADGDGFDNADLAIDGEAVAGFPAEVPLPIGLHLVVATAPERKPFASMVEVYNNRDSGVVITLDDEDEVTQIRRMRDDTLSAQSEDDRIDQAHRLAALTGGRRVLVIDGSDSDHLQVRVFDSITDTATKAMSLKEASRPSVLAALLGVDSGMGGDPPPIWYKRWYVWVAVGTVVVAGAVGGYAYSQRDPTRITGF